MKKSIIYCDHCGEELDNLHDMTELTIDLGSEWFDTDLCNDCWHELNYKVKQFCKKDGAEQ